MNKRKLSPKSRAYVEGQALLLVILALSVGLIVAAVASQRTVTSILRFTLSDSAKRSQIMAESAAENYLLKDSSDLETLSGVCGSAILFTDANVLPANPDSRCVYVPSGAGVGLTSKYRAVVAVDKYPVTVNEPVYLDIPRNDVGEVVISGYTGANVQVCWTGYNDSGTTAISDLYYFRYYTSGSNYLLDKRYVKCSTSAPWCIITDSFLRTLDDSPSTSYVDGNTCFTVTTSSGTKALRFMSIHNTSKVKISPASGVALPYQGYRITTIGELTQSDPERNPRKKVSVEVSFPYLPVGFDMAITSLTGTISP